MGVKKQEAPAYDPRGIQGMGLQYATSNTGACYASGYTVIDEILGVHQKMDPVVTEGKTSLVKLFQDVTAVIDSSGLCPFLLLGVWVDDVLAMLEADTGAGYTEESLLLAGERIWNLERLFNLSAGFSSKDDTLPQRMLQEPMPKGPARGQICKLDQMLPEYYRLRGWDENGVPTQKILAELGLEMGGR
jgi:aldehyde:ferredoxin oxidoreductase